MPPSGLVAKDYGISVGIVFLSPTATSLPGVIAYLGSLNSV